MFISELAQLINKYSLDNGSNTPDYMLADYLNDCLENYNKIMMARDSHFKLAAFGGNDCIRGTNLEQLVKNEKSLAVLLPHIGKKIKAINMDDNRLILEFSDYERIAVFDYAQHCCENRYMSTDDDITYFVGAELWDIVLRNVECSDDEYSDDEYSDAHDVQFLEVRTSKGVFTLANHNNHNGYYGGFWIVAKKL